jgi:hypothetical protein
MAKLSAKIFMTSQRLHLTVTLNGTGESASKGPLAKFHGSVITNRAKETNAGAVSKVTAR